MKSGNLDWIILLPLISILLVLSKFILAEQSVDSSFILYDLIALSFFVFYVFIQMSKVQRVGLKVESERNEIFKQIAESQEVIRRQQAVINDFQGKVKEVEKDTAKIQLIVSQVRNFSNIKSSKQKLEKLITLLSSQFEFSAGVIYIGSNQNSLFDPIVRYALDPGIIIPSIELGAGLGGEVLRNNEVRVISSVPADYLLVSSGLGESLPSYLYFLPISDGDVLVGLIELASFKKLGIHVGWSELNREIANLLAKD